jgi:transcriptional regulator with XRE-family HTH domain
MARGRVFNGGKARELRKDKANLTLSQLVEAIGVNPETGRPWHRDTITNVELGHTQPGPDLASAWANALDVPLQRLYIATWDDLPELPAAQIAWMADRQVEVVIADVDGRCLDRFVTNDGGMARRRVERALAAMPSAEVTLTLQDTP